MSLPPFNPNRPRPKANPGEGDDVACIKCGAVALDTGLECSECGHDNYEAATGKPFGVDTRTCTCYPDETRPAQCQHKYALSECRAVAGLPDLFPPGGTSGVEGRKP
jgi:hypothetical protein